MDREIKGTSYFYMIKEKVINHPKLLGVGVIRWNPELPSPGPKWDHYGWYPEHSI